MKHRYCKDLILKKFEVKFIRSLRDFINTKITEIKSKEKLLTINYNFILYNKRQFFLTTLGDYFSNDVSSKYFNIEKDYNRKLIYKLIHEDKVFENIFNKTILECLEHFRGTKKINGLEGLENEYSKMIEKLQQNEEDEEYILDFINIIYTLDKR